MGQATWKKSKAAEGSERVVKDGTAMTRKQKVQKYRDLVKQHPDEAQPWTQRTYKSS